MNYTPVPFLRIGFLLVLAIVITEKTEVDFVWLFPLLGGVSLFIFWFFQIKRPNIQLELAQKNGLFLGLVFLFGVFITLHKQQKAKDNYISCYDGETVGLTVVLQEALKSTKGARYIAQVSTIQDCNGNAWTKSHKVILVFHADDDDARFYKMGSKVNLRGDIYRIPKPNNPQAFDYASYMYYQDVVQQVRVGVGTHCLHLDDDQSFWYNTAYKAGNYAAEVFDKYLSELYKPLADALLVGRRADLQEELYDLFSITGCIHVLSVSGMHVAIFAAPLLYLVTRFGRESLWIKLIQIFILTGLIWFYVVLTGLSPSVVRSGVMITILCFAKVFTKRTYGVHILFLTLVMLLVVNPYYLFQLSFQFSFLSLLSLQLFYTEIKNSFIHKWTAVNYIWDVTAASIAAQILILPVSIFYFNMFPVYFILGSIVAVPLVTMIIYVGTILVVMESVWADINAVLGFFMQSVMEILMRSMESIVDLPHSVVRDIYLGPLGLFLFMAAAITFLVWFKQKGLISFYVCLALLFCGIAENRWHSLLAVNQNELVVYDVRGRSQLLVDIIQGRVVHCITSLPLGHKTMRYAAGNYRLSRRIHEVIYNLYTTHEKSRAFSLRGFHGLIIPGIEGTDVSLQNRNKVNMLYITGNCWDRQHFLYQIYKPDYVVLHASLSRKEYQAWVKLQLLECFILHDARNEGAFTLKL